MIELTGNNVVLVGIVAVIGLAALVVAGILVREVLAASEGTERMKEIGAAVQEGAAAYLNRQFKTLSIFAVVVFFLLFLLPAETNTERIGRSRCLKLQITGDLLKIHLGIMDCQLRALLQ